ncbi:Vacuolar protein sorting-associated protein 4 [Linnemannia exigua]|uniref:Vacuolar protein sorting-associated protein 4 n=1 Tax=Linnemannia exigua TaxID=604196 RepID=A0AAD4DCV5_9FUNG|nr:Vacuolar protein sorting-associated protein 4 [Linnemannia exigua]
MQRSHTTQGGEQQGKFLGEAAETPAMKRRKSMESAKFLSPNSAIMSVSRRKSFDQLSSLRNSDSKSRRSSDASSTASQKTGSSDTSVTTNTSMSGHTPASVSESIASSDYPHHASGSEIRALYLSGRTDSGNASMQPSPLIRSISQPVIEQVRLKRPPVSFASEVVARQSLDLQRLAMNQERATESERLNGQLRNDSDSDLPGQLFRRRTMQEANLNSSRLSILPRHHSAGPTTQSAPTTPEEMPGSGKGSQYQQQQCHSDGSSKAMQDMAAPRLSTSSISSLSGSSTVSGRFSRMWSSSAANSAAAGGKENTTPGTVMGNWNAGEFGEASAEAAAQSLVRPDLARARGGGMLNRNESLRDVYIRRHQTMKQLSLVNVRAVETVKRATEEDTKGRLEETLPLYQTALEYFLTALKYEKNERVRDTVRKRVVEYMARSEKIKEHPIKMEDGPKKKAIANSSNGGKGGKKKDSDDDGEDDADTKKLKGALVSAILSENPISNGSRVPWKGILLYGPPGTGKSFLVKAVATEANSTFFPVSSSDLVSKWMRESERLVKQLFQMARENKPAIILIDEVDSLCGTHGEGDSEASRRVKTEFLVQMNGVGNDMEGILVLGATSIPWQLDSAIRRRFEKRIYIPLPDSHARARMFELNVGTTPCLLTAQDYQHLGQITEGYSGSDIAIAVRDALSMLIRRSRPAHTSPGDPDVLEMNWENVEADDVMDHAKFTLEFGSEEIAPSLRLVLIGDSGVGKSKSRELFLNSVPGQVNKDDSSPDIAALSIQGQPAEGDSSEASQETNGTGQTNGHTKPQQAHDYLYKDSVSTLQIPQWLSVTAVNNNNDNPSNGDGENSFSTGMVPAENIVLHDFVGYGETLDARRNIDRVDAFLTEQYHATRSLFGPSISPLSTTSHPGPASAGQQPVLQPFLEQLLVDSSMAHTLPDACLYFVLYDLKPVDIHFMKRIMRHVNLIPILAKADTLSINQLWKAKSRILKQLEENQIEFFQFGYSLEDLKEMASEKMAGGPPFVLSTSELEVQNVGQPAASLTDLALAVNEGRFSEGHSDLCLLQTLLLGPKNRILHQASVKKFLNRWKTDLGLPLEVEEQPSPATGSSSAGQQEANGATSASAPAQQSEQQQQPVQAPEQPVQQQQSFEHQEQEQVQVPQSPVQPQLHQPQPIAQAAYQYQHTPQHNLPPSLQQQTYQPTSSYIPSPYRGQSQSSLLGGSAGGNNSTNTKDDELGQVIKLSRAQSVIRSASPSAKIYTQGSIVPAMPSNLSNSSSPTSPSSTPPPSSLAASIATSD